MKPLAHALGVEVAECARRSSKWSKQTWREPAKRCWRSAVSILRPSRSSLLRRSRLTCVRHLRCAWLQGHFPSRRRSLSARGIDSADDYLSATRPVYEDLTHSDDAQVGRILNDAFKKIACWPQVSHSQAFADLRYRGQTFTLPIECTTSTPTAALAHAFKREHRHRYGYIFEARPIEWVQTRVFVWTDARAPRPQRECIATQHQGPETIRQYSATVFVPEHWHYGRPVR